MKFIEINAGTEGKILVDSTKITHFEYYENGSGTIYLVNDRTVYVENSQVSQVLSFLQ